MTDEELNALDAAHEESGLLDGWEDLQAKVALADRVPALVAEVRRLTGERAERDRALVREADMRADKEHGLAPYEHTRLSDERCDAIIAAVDRARAVSLGVTPVMAAPRGAK